MDNMTKSEDIRAGEARTRGKVLRWRRKYGMTMSCDMRIEGMSRIDVRQHGDRAVGHGADEVHGKALVEPTPALNPHDALRRVHDTLA